MGEIRTVHVRVKCDWCGVEKEGKIEDNQFAEITIDDDEYRKTMSDKKYEWMITFRHNNNRTLLCPSCYEPVRVFLKQIAEDRKKLIMDLNEERRKEEREEREVNKFV